MNRNEFVDIPNEVISEIGDDFVFSKGQVFREKPYDDEYIVLLEVGDQVNEQCDGLVTDGQVQYNARFWNCTPHGRPVRVTWQGSTTSEGFNHTDSLRKYYFFTGIISSASNLERIIPAEKSDYIGRIQGTNPWIDTIERKPKDRRTGQEKEEMERYEARMSAKAMHEAGITIREFKPRHADTTGTSSSDLSTYKIYHY